MAAEKKKSMKQLRKAEGASTRSEEVEANLISPHFGHRHVIMSVVERMGGRLLLPQVPQVAGHLLPSASALRRLAPFRSTRRASDGHHLSPVRLSNHASATAAAAVPFSMWQSPTNRKLPEDWKVTGNLPQLSCE